MMKHKLVAIRDIRTNVYSTPQSVPSLAGWLRQLKDEVNTPRENNMLNRHPQDFEAYELGDYNDEDASFELHPKPRQVMSLADMVESRQ